MISFSHQKSGNLYSQKQTRLAALNDVEAVESAQERSANAVYRENQDTTQRSKDECNAKRNACVSSCSNIKDYSSLSNCMSGCIICNY